MKKPLLPIVFVAFAGLGFGALASAEVEDFKASEKLDSRKMNAKFKEIGDRLVAAETRSTKSAYCGSTAATKGDLSGLGVAKGYVAARSACKSIAACGAASAHVCSGDEVVNAASLGAPMPTGRFQTGVAALSYGGAGILLDCSGWQTANQGAVGAFWNGRGELGGELTPAGGACEVEKPILCCN
jgi:hypothetical protein